MITHGPSYPNLLVPEGPYKAKQDKFLLYGHTSVMSKGCSHHAALNGFRNMIAHSGQGAAAPYRQHQGLCQPTLWLYMI